MPKNEVKLKKCFPPFKKLWLDGREIEVATSSDEESRTVVWDITDNPPSHHWQHISSFRIVGKSGSNPFSGPIPSDFQPSLQLIVRNDAPEEEWSYTIEWNDRRGNTRHDDPKISILPELLVPKRKKIIVPLVTITLVLLGLIYLVKKDKKG